MRSIFFISRALNACKRKIFALFFALAASVGISWAAEMEGPWTYMDHRTGSCDRTDNMSIAFNGMNNSHWGTVSDLWNDNDGIGFTLKGTSPTNSKNGIFSTYYIDQSLTSYTRKRLTWVFQIGSRSSKHYSNTCLYGLQGTWQQINALSVDFTEEYTNGSGSSYLLAQYRNTTLNQSGGSYTGNITKTFDFDNRNGSGNTTKSWCLLLTHVVSSVGSVSDIHEWGAFRSVSASWATYYYKILTFNGNGATSGSMSQQTVENGPVAVKANAFSRTGYSFDGWATSATGARAYYNNGDITATESSKGPVTLYALWKANTYTVTLNKQNGTGGSNSVTATYDANMPSATMPTREGYTFQGYFDAASGGTKYYNANGSSARTWNKTANSTLYAQWSVVTYTISYNLAGGAVTTANPANYNIETATFTLNNPVRTGYTFAGWTGSNGETPQTTVQIAKGSTGNKTYTANWTPVAYNITYNYDKGKGTNPATYTIETETFQLAAPTRLGYTFLGWTGSNGETKQLIVQIAKGSLGDKNYVAHWELNPNTHVSYVDSLGAVVAEEMSTFNRPEEPDIEGFTFVRWEVQEGPLSAGIYLRAIYTENTPSGAPAKKVGKFTLVRKDETNEYILETDK